VGDDRPFEPAGLLGSGVARLVLWGGNCYADKLPPSAEWIVWQKLADTATESDFSSAELAWTNPPTGRTGHVRRVVCGQPKGTTLDGEDRLHPTQKPVKVQRAPIEWYTEPGDDVEDWYMGAGAVIIACEQTGRIGHGMDIAHAYLAATLERLSTRGLVPRLVQ
jgi:DNA modification methylase